MADVSCGSCRYWIRFDGSPEPGIGTCVRFPPTCVLDDPERKYPRQFRPQVAAVDWCGEWATKQSTEEA